MTEPTTPTQLVTLGRLAIVNMSGDAPAFADSAKLLALLAYLAARPGRRATRDQLIDLFWADSPVDKARNSLRQALHKLRNGLGDDLFTDTGTGDIVLSTAVATDRDAFLAALDSGDLDAALSHYTGPFAPGIVSAGSAGFEHWADSERDRLHDHFAGAAETVAQRLIIAGDPRCAKALAQRLIDTNPLDERAWRLRLEAEMASGSRIHIAASIAELQRLLTENNRQPEARTRQLVERLNRSAGPTLDDRGKATLIADLVGREAEFGRLYQGWRSASARHAWHVHITAPPGVGKTRLLDDFAFRLGAERGRVVRARATPRQRTVTGSVLSMLVSVLADLPGATGIADRSARILVDLQPAIAAKFANSAPMETADADERRRMRTDALVDLLVALADEAPICLLLDDLHWWDMYSRELIGDVIERMSGKAIAVVTASRPGTGEIATSTSAPTITLAALDAQQIAALLTSLGEADDSTQVDQLATGLYAATSGVPLLVIEALRLGFDRSVLCLEKAKWDFTTLDEFLTSLRPGSALAERIAALAPSQRDLLLLVSVIEEPMNETRAVVGGITASGPAFMELERLGMLAPKGHHWMAAHDLIAQLTIDSATTAEVQRAHRIAGQVLVASAENESAFADAARHTMDGDDRRPLVEVCSEWVRRCRARDDSRSGLAIVRTLLGPQADGALVAAVVSEMPPVLRYGSFRKQMTWMIAAAAFVTILGAGWWRVAASSEPDLTFGAFVGRPERAEQFAVQIRTSGWDRTHADLSAIAASKLNGRFPGSRLALNGEPVAAPDGRRWLVSRITDGENSPTELGLIDSSGVEHPIAVAHGDNTEPDWSPDGRYAVFMTTRWSPRADVDFDLGILDVSSGTARRLTSETSSDEQPHWSPDGTRIAFMKKPAELAPDELCWITPDGSRQRCRTIAAGIRGVVGWIDQGTILALVGAGADNVIESIAIDGDQMTPLFAAPVDSPLLSPNGEWLLCNCAVPEARSAAPRLTLFPVHHPEAHRQVRGVPDSGFMLAYWYPGKQRASLARLRIVSPRDSIALDASFRMAVLGTATDGNRMDPPDGVLVWRSSDPTIATVDSNTGDLHPSRRGSVWVRVSAGGWQRDSIQIEISGPVTSIAFHEDWSPTWQERWGTFGPDPRPQTVSSSAIGRSFTPNGNGTYSDGAFTRERFAATAGLGVESMIQSPITRPKWQHIGLAISQIDTIAPGGPTGDGCGTLYPYAEGWSSLHIMGVPGGVIKVADELATGKPFRLRLQLFPDGSCGVAINGRPVSRSSHRTSTDHPMAVIVRGQSVSTHMLLGPLTVWHGVRGDLDWSRLGQDTASGSSHVVLGRKP